MFNKLKEKKLALIALLVLGTLCVITVFAEFIAPYDYDEDNRENPYQPPTKIHCIDAGGRFHFIPFVYTSDKYLSENYERIYTESTAKHYSLRLFPKGDAYHLWGVIKWDRHLFGVGESAKMYLCGTDARGRDLFSRIVHGGRISLSIGIIGVFIAMVLGTIIGGLAGYFGGIVDQCIMRCAELFMMIPSFYLLLAIRASLPPDLSSAHVYFFVTCLLSLIGWAGLARIIRGMVLSLKEQDFVLAARLLGTNHFNVIVKHLLPHTTSYLLVAMSISIPGYILAESALSLLGLGIQEPFVSWGMLLSDALSIAQLKFHVWMLFPGVFIFITVFCCNVLGDSLRDVMDPLTKMKL